MIRAIAIVALLSGCGTVDTVIAVAKGCGTERVLVKLAKDAGAQDIRTAPVGTTIEALGGLTSADGLGERVEGAETTVWRITAKVYAIVPEEDGDYHLRLSDAKGNLMIAETPSDECAKGSRFAPEMAAARKAAESMKGSLPVTATITGVGFWDHKHNVLGAAPSGIELHPVLSVR